MPLYLKERLKKSFICKSLPYVIWQRRFIQSRRQAGKYFEQKFITTSERAWGTDKIHGRFGKIIPNDCAKKGDIFMKLLFSEGDSKRYWTLTI